MNEPEKAIVYYEREVGSKTDQELINELKERNSPLKKIKAMGGEGPLVSFATKLDALFGDPIHQSDVRAVKKRKEMELTERLKRVIYNDGDTSVKSVGVSSLMEPTFNTLVLDLAEGTTVDKYLDETKEEEYRIMQRFFAN